ncbi:hypothetical protein [Actinoplanes derwentensis]|uniref:hypothetical protein n=1 Tax=Actinoplanes derwentensis TaxID=113562 RepID=UPI001E50C7AD|nr:hypothetical protein [Actinoplanes derwentensis]
MVADADRAEEIVIRLARIGFDRVLGYLHEPGTALTQTEGDLTRANRITAADPADLGGHRRDHLTDHDSPASNGTAGRARHPVCLTPSRRQIRRRH